MALFRFLLGVGLMGFALPHLDHSFLENLPNQLTTMAHKSHSQLYQLFMLHWVIPRAIEVGAFIPVIQFLMGISLAIGFFTQFSAVLGFLYGANLLVASWGNWETPNPALGALMILATVTIFIADAGCYYGLDGWLFHREEKPVGKKPKFKNKKQQQVVEALNQKLKASGKGKKRAKVLEES